MPVILLCGYFVSASLGVYSVGEDLAKRLQNRGWIVITTSGQKNRWLRLLDMIYTVWTRREDYSVAHVDVFFSTAFVWAEVVCWILRLFSKPYSLTLHSGGFPGWAATRKNRVKRLLKYAQVVTAPSQYLAEQMNQYRRNIRLVPNAIDVKTYQYRKRALLEHKLVWIRAYSETYNPLLALKVVALLAEDYPNLVLSMYGPPRDSTWNHVHEAVKTLGLKGKVDVFGAAIKSDIPGILAMADVFINTTNRDNTPVTILEALASGLCVVSTDVDGIPYLLENEVDSLLVPPNDPAAMATAIKRLWTDPQLAGRLSQNARKKAESMDYSIILPRWESLFREINNGYTPH